MEQMRTVTPPPPMRNVVAWVLGLGAVIGIALLAACAPMARTPATNGGGPAGGGEPPAAPTTPDPAPTTPQETEQRWTLDAPHFGDDDAAIWAETSNRSTPFAWDRITADNLDAVRVSIGGHELPLENREYPPVFADDVSGAEWDLDAEVNPGAVTLVLTAEDQSIRVVKSVRITSPGSGYTATPVVSFQPPARGRPATGEVVLAPTHIASVSISHAGLCGGAAPSVTFSAPQTPGGVRAIGVAIKPFTIITNVHMTNYGSGYTATPTVTFARCPRAQDAHRDPARGTAVLSATAVASVRITDDGSGYKPGENGVTIAAPGSGSQAEGVAVIGRRGNTEADNLYWARQALYGKELLIRLAPDE